MSAVELVARRRLGETVDPGFGRKVIGYLLLGKARIYQHSYGLVLAYLLVRAEVPWHAGLGVALAFSFVALQAVQYSAGAADDLGGFRDGSDAVNYAGRPAVTIAKKPLLTGVVSERGAVRFILVMSAIGVAATVAGAWFGNVASIAPVLVMLAVQALVLQYSLGLKLSYRPLGLEVTVFTMTGAVVLLPFWFATGTVTAGVVATSALFGVWFLMVVCYGNASDLVGDKAVCRRTLAVLLPMRVYKVFLGGLYLCSLGLLVTVFAIGGFVGFQAIATMAPLVVLHTAQLYSIAFQDNWRRARFLGILSLDLGGLGLVAAAWLS